MNPPLTAAGEQSAFQRLVDVFIRVGLIFLLGYWCFDIVRPFLLPVLWGVTLAVALYPGFDRLQRVLGGRRRLAATVVALLGIGVLVVPSYYFLASLVESSVDVLERLRSGELEIPPPPDWVKKWPFVGERFHAEWASLSEDLEGTIERLGPQLQGVIAGAASTLTGLGGVVLQFLISLVIAAVFMAKSDSGDRAFHAIFRRLVGERGDELAKLTTDTIRNVAKGVVGVALIQTLLCGIGLFVAGVPATGLWTLLILILAVIQLPTLIVLVPIMVYQFYAVETLPAVLFAIWSTIAGASDTFLKSWFLGRGLKTPMLVILIGALGGMIWAGILGLFIGAVVLSLGYELLLAWIHSEDGVGVSAKNAVEGAALPADAGS